MMVPALACAALRNQLQASMAKSAGAIVLRFMVTEDGEACKCRRRQSDAPRLSESVRPHPRCGEGAEHCGASWPPRGDPPGQIGRAGPPQKSSAMNFPGLRHLDCVRSSMPSEPEASSRSFAPDSASDASSVIAGDMPRGKDESSKGEWAIVRVCPDERTTALAAESEGFWPSRRAHMSNDLKARYAADAAMGGSLAFSLASTV
jgi:hypothetical protein